ncbi:unnamed protein product [Urochloa humidicola]
MLIAVMKDVKRRAGRRQGRTGEQALLTKGGLWARQLLRTDRKRRKGEQVLLGEGESLKQKMLHADLQRQRAKCKHLKAQLRVFSKAHLQDLSKAQLQELIEAQLHDLSKEQLQDLSKRHLQYLSNAHLHDLSKSQLEDIIRLQLQDLSKTQLHDISNTHIQDPSEQLQIAAATPFVNALGHVIPVAVLDLFFVDEITQKLQSFTAYAEQSAPILQVTLPGGGEKKHTKSADHATNLMAALLDFNVRLYELGFSLDGNFGPEDFGISHSGFLRGLRNLLDKLRPRSVPMTAKDMNAAADVTQNCIFKSATYGPLPADVADLMVLLRNFDPALIPLLHIHVARERGSRKDMLFTIMYNHLVIIKAENPKAYSKIMGKIQKRNWIHKAMSNVHLHELLRFQGSPTSLFQKISYFLVNKVGYKPRTDQLLLFRRNAQSHLLKDYSYVGFAGAEEGLRAALAFAMDRKPSIAAAVGVIAQPNPAENAEELKAIMVKGFPDYIAAVADTIKITLQS